MGRRDDWTKILGWPGYQVYQHEIDEKQKTLKLWVRRKRSTKKLICSGCGKHCGDLLDSTEREIRDLPWSEYKATVVVGLYRVRCPDCGPKIEKVAQLPSKAPFSSASRKRWDGLARRHRRGKWRRVLDCRRARCARSTCGI